MELRQILEILFRRKWMIMSMFLAIFLTIFLGSLLIHPWYTATAKVFLQRSTASSTLLSGIGLQGVSASSASLAYSDTDRADYLALAAVRPVVDKVIEQEHVTRERTRAILIRKLPFLKPILKAFGANVDDTMQVMKAEDLINRSMVSYIFPRPYVKIDQQESTDIITFEAMATEPEQASRIANSIARSFLENELNRVRADFKGARDYIQNNMKHYNNEYAKALRDLKEFKESQKTVNLDLETTEYIKQISDLKQTQGNLYVALAETKTKYKPNHPAVIDIQNKIEETKRLIQQKSEKVFGALPSSNMANKASNDAELAVNPEQNFALPSDSSKRDDDALMGLPQKSLQFAQLALAVSVTQDFYNVLLKYRYQVGIAESIALSNSYIVETALTPEIDDSKHKYPRTGLNSIIAILLGTIFGIGAGLFAEYLDDTIKTADHLRAFKTITYLGRITKLRKRELKLIDEQDPRSSLNEAFRTIRNSIRFATLDKPVKSLLVTSAVPGEGRSFVASNVAISAVNGGKKVLIVDADLRRPSLHTYFGLDNSSGLTDYLAGGVSLESIQKQSRISGLSVITTGTVPSDPAKLVESRRMHQLLEDLENAYDLVILDSPSVFTASDAIILGQYIDGTVVVVESGKTSRKDFADMTESLQKGGIVVVGAVLNKAEVHERAY